MNNKHKVEVTLLVSNRPGVLSTLVIKGGSLGLTYKKQYAEKLDTENSRMVITFYGELNCNKHQSIDTFKEYSEVIKVEKIVVTAPNQVATDKKQ